MDKSTPPRRSIKALIREAIQNRYGLRATISKDGYVKAGFMGLAHVSEWHTTRSDAMNIRLYQRGVLMFTFFSDN